MNTSLFNNAFQHRAICPKRMAMSIVLTVLILCVTILGARRVQAEATDANEPTQFTTTITVNTTSDPSPTTSTISCTLDGNGVKPADDGLCSLRRAIIEASKHNVAERPILIQFNLPAGEANTTVPGTWTIDAGAGLPPIETLSAVAEPDSQVTIDGTTQPGGRDSDIGPAVFVKMGGPLSFNRNQNTIRGMGFYGGGSLQLGRASSRERSGQHRVENVWMGLSTGLR